MGQIRHQMINMHPHLELKKICDNRPLEKNSRNKNFKLVSDPIEIIESDIDAVFICTPNHMIPELAINCLEIGKNFFFEKPQCKTLDDIKLIRND